jgi:hypothetical protein
MVVKLPGLSEFRQIDLIERITIPDMPPNDIRFVVFDLSRSTSPNRPVLIDPPQSVHGEKTNKRQVPAVFTISHLNKAS